MRSLWIWLGFSVAVMAILLLGLRVINHGPALTSSEFDTNRAYETIIDLIPENKAHPLGTPENRLVRARLESKLTDLGLAPQLQETVLCSDERTACAAVENIFAIKPGLKTNDNAILVTVHYDSTLSGPGAGDDMAGAAAVLEVIRLISKESFQNDIIFLFADAEEAGLWGARAFATENPLMDRVKLVLNLEARGVTGPSSMFETSANNLKLISMFASAVSRPVANSLTYEIYRKMPNDTDMSVYKEHGAAGLNFAFAGGVALYHTSRDDPAHLNKNSLAHHGDNLLSTLRIAANATPESLSASGDAVYFDLFGKHLIHWPAWLNLPLLGLTFATIIFAGLRADAFSLRSGMLTLVAFFSILIGLGAIGWILTFPLAIWPAVAFLDHPHPLPGRIAILAVSLFVPLLIAPRLLRSSGYAAALFSTWIIIALIGLAFALLLPGASYIALAPAIIFAMAAIIESFVTPHSKGSMAGHIGFAAAAYIGIYHALSFEIVLSFHLSYIKTLVLFLPAIAAAPLVIWHIKGNPRQLWPTTALAGSIAVAAFISSMMPSYTVDRPRSVNFAYEQIENVDGSRNAHWRLHTYGPDADSVAKNIGFTDETKTYKLYNFYKLQAYFKPASDFHLPNPNLSINSKEQKSDQRILHGTLSPGREGVYYGIAFEKDAQIERFTVNGINILSEKTLAKSENGGFTMFLGMGDKTVDFELVTGIAPISATLYEISPLPDVAETSTLTAKRPATAVTSNMGDYAEVQKRIQL